MSTSRAVPVTLAEIARLAGVGRAAVSNWRRRHPSFPERIAGTDTNPQFSLTDIEGWLRDNKKLKKSAEQVPVIELLNDEVDLTPGRHIASSPADTAPRLAESWREFTGLTANVNKSARLLAALDLATAEADTPTATTVAELARARALTLRGGQQPPEEAIHAGPPSDDGIPLLTVPDLLVDGEPRSWLAPGTAAAGEAVIAEPGDDAQGACHYRQVGTFASSGRTGFLDRLVTQR